MRLNSSTCRIHKPFHFLYAFLGWRQKYTNKITNWSLRYERSLVAGSDIKLPEFHVGNSVGPTIQRRAHDALNMALEIR